MLRASGVRLARAHAAGAVLPDRGEVLKALANTRLLARPSPEGPRARRGGRWRRVLATDVVEELSVHGPSLSAAASEWSDAELVQKLRPLAKGFRRIRPGSGHEHTAEHLLEEAKRRLVAFDEHNLAGAAAGSVSPPATARRELLQLAVKACIGLGRPAEAEELLFPPEVVRAVFPYCMLLRAYARAGETERAFSVYSRMADHEVMLKRAQGVPRERGALLEVFNSLIAACQQQEECHSSVMMWLAEANKLGLSPSRRTFHQLARSWWRIAEHRKAEEAAHPGHAIDAFFSLMEDRGVQPNSSTVQALLDHCCTREEHIVRVLRHMEEKHRFVEHNPATRVALLRAYVRVGAGEKVANALKALVLSSPEGPKMQRMLQQLQAHEASGDFRQKSKTEELRMAAKHVAELAVREAVSTELFLVAIQRARSSAALDEAELSLWQGMRNMMMAPSVNAFRAVLMSIARSAWDRRGCGGMVGHLSPLQVRVEAATAAAAREHIGLVWRDTVALFPRPPLRLYHELLRAYSASGNILEAVDAVEVMPLLALMPTTRTYSILFQACVHEGCLEAALLVVRLMAESNVALGKDVRAAVAHLTHLAEERAVWNLPCNREVFMQKVDMQLASPATFIRKKQHRAKHSIFLTLRQELQARLEQK